MRDLKKKSSSGIGKAIFGAAGVGLLAGGLAAALSVKPVPRGFGKPPLKKKPCGCGR